MKENVLRLRFGLDDGRTRTLEEVGKVFGVTRERIRQIEAKALRKLRHPSRSKRFKRLYGINSSNSGSLPIFQKEVALSLCLFLEGVMRDERTKTIVREIKYWKQYRLLPDEYCDFLLALYTQGETEKEQPNKDVHHPLFYLWMCLSLLLLPLSFLVIYFY